MAKAKGKTAEADVDSMGVATRHHYLMANDEEYRKRALTPPGGLAPGEGDKDDDKASDVEAEAEPAATKA